MPILTTGSGLFSVISGGGGPPVTVTFAGHAESSTSTSVFTGVSIGTANTNRIVAVCVGGRMNTSGDGITSVILHIPDITGDPTGTTLTRVSGSGSGSANIAISEIFSGLVPSGTSATVSVLFGGALSARSGISTYAVVTATPTPSDGQAITAAADAGLTQSVTVPSNGGAIGWYFMRNPTSPGTPITWTNATKDFEFQIGSPNATTSSATVSGTGSISVTATPTGTPTANGDALSLAAWGP